MSYRITKDYVWAGEIDDHRGALAEKLMALGEGGLNLELITSRRTSPGRGVLFVSPLKTLEEVETAERAGLPTENSFHIIRVQGPNAPGLGARIAHALADAGLNMRDFTAAALGKEAVTNIALDSDDDADRAREVLEKALNG